MNTYLTDPSTGDIWDSDTFDIHQHVSRLDAKLIVDSPEYRKVITKYDPLLWALIYVPHMLKSEQTDNQLSLNDLNLSLFHYGLELAKPKTHPKTDGLRRAFMAPRGAGKTTTVQIILLWAAAHRHLRYIYVFSGSDNQAESHLHDIKNEIFNNALIRNDYASLCVPNQYKVNKVSEADNKNLYISKSGITLEARSLWSGVVGAKRDGKRPDCLILDDCSRGEGSGSIHQSTKQLDVLLGTILPLNDAAAVWGIGTVHYAGSVEDELVRSTLGEEFRWIKDENFTVHWLKPLIEQPGGKLRSIWKQRWTVDFLLAESGKRTYAKSFLNRPISSYEGMGWEQQDFIIGSPPSISKIIVSVDPGISDKGDPTGVSVIGFSVVSRKAVIMEAFEARLKGVELKKLLLNLVAIHSATDLVWEATQGGQALAHTTLGDDFPIRVHLVYPKENKLVRAEVLLARYKNLQIVHASRFPAYELQCISFPKFTASPNILDSVGQGVEWLAKNSTANHSSLKVGAR